MIINRLDDEYDHVVVECSWKGMIRTDLDACKFQELMNEIDSWLIQKELGYQKVYNKFGLYDERAYTLFLLRWRDVRI